MLLKPLDIFGNGLLDVLELKEVNVVDGLATRRPALLHEGAELRCLHSHHTAAGVVEDRDLTRAEKALGYDQAPKRVLPEERDRMMR